MFTVVESAASFFRRYFISSSHTVSCCVAFWKIDTK